MKKLYEYNSKICRYTVNLLILDEPKEFCFSCNFVKNRLNWLRVAKLARML